MTWGLLRPVVLLPSEADRWPRDRLHDVLLHELAHVRRLDSLTQAIALVACALYWFNPLAWLAARQMRHGAGAGLRRCGPRRGVRPSDYAGHLLELARRLRSARVVSFATVSMARPSQLEGRLLAILDPSRRRSPISRRIVGLGVIASAAMMLPLASIRLDVHATEPNSTREHTEATTTEAADPQSEGKASVSGIVSDAQGKLIAGGKWRSWPNRGCQPTMRESQPVIVSWARPGPIQRAASASNSSVSLSRFTLWRWSLAEPGGAWVTTISTPKT